MKDDVKTLFFSIVPLQGEMYAVDREDHSGLRGHQKYYLGRGLQEEDAKDREKWSLGLGRRQ